MTSIRDIFQTIIAQNNGQVPSQLQSPLLARHFGSQFGGDNPMWSPDQSAYWGPTQYTFPRAQIDPDKFAAATPEAVSRLPGMAPSVTSRQVGDDGDTDVGGLGQNPDDVPEMSALGFANDLASRGVVDDIISTGLGFANPALGLAAKASFNLTDLGDRINNFALETLNPGLSFDEFGIGSYSPPGGVGLGEYGTPDAAYAQALDESDPGPGGETAAGQGDPSSATDVGSEYGGDFGGGVSEDDVSDDQAAEDAAEADADEEGGSEDYAKGGLVNRLRGSNPAGPDDGWGAMDRGEYVIRKSMVNRYGKGFFDKLNQGKIPKGLLAGILR